MVIEIDIDKYMNFYKGKFEIIEKILKEVSKTRKKEKKINSVEYFKVIFNLYCEKEEFQSQVDKIKDVKKYEILLSML